MTYTFHKHYPRLGVERVIDVTCIKCGWRIYPDFEDYHYQRITQSDRGYVRDTPNHLSYKHKHCFQALD